MRGSTGKLRLCLKLCMLRLLAASASAPWKQSRAQPHHGHRRCVVPLPATGLGPLHNPRSVSVLLANWHPLPPHSFTAGCVSSRMCCDPTAPSTTHGTSRRSRTAWCWSCRAAGPWAPSTWTRRVRGRFLASSSAIAEGPSCSYTHHGAALGQALNRRRSCKPSVIDSWPPTQVGQDVTLSVPSKRGEPQRKLRVLVRTEGPTRVLTVLDSERHRWAAWGCLRSEAGNEGTRSWSFRLGDDWRLASRSLVPPRRWLEGATSSPW